MQITTVTRAGAVASALAILALAGSPALAADPIAQGSATGASIAIGGQTQQSGNYTATNDGTSETTTGTKTAALGALGGQNAASLGTAAQDVVTSVVGNDGRSAACAGLAGNGASLAAAGTGSTCLSGGSNVNLSNGGLNLSQVTLTNPALPGVAAIDSAVQTLAAQLNTVTNTALTALGNPAVVVSLGAVQSSCTADPTTADGTANIANAGAYVDLPAFAGQPAQRISLLTFPANPAPNTKVVTGLDKVSTVITSALTNSINTTAASGSLTSIPGLQAIATQFGIALGTVQQQVVDQAVAALQPALGPLEANVLDGTLNKQSKSAANQITVTALDLKILPVAGANGGQVTIGTSSCGPNSRRAVAPAAATATPTPKAPKNNKTPKAPKVPTSVPAGLADAPSRNAPLGPWALAGMGALLVASAGAGTAAYRRSTSRL